MNNTVSKSYNSICYQFLQNNNKITKPNDGNCDKKNGNKLIKILKFMIHLKFFSTCDAMKIVVSVKTSEKHVATLN